MKVKYQGAYKDTTPYVKYNGVYAPATVYVKEGGAYLPSGTGKYAYDFDGLTQYVQLSSDIDVAANQDFELKFKAIFGGSATTYPIGRLADFNSRISYVPASGLSVRTVQNASALSRSPAGFVNYVNKLTNYRLVRSDNGATLTFYAEDEVIATGAIATSNTFQFQAIQRNGTSYGINVVSDYEMWIDGDSTTGTKILDLPLTNKAQGANQIGLVGGINGTIMNYTSGGWIEL